VWSLSNREAAELLDAHCPILAHDAAVGWIAGCVAPTRVGGDGIHRLHTYDDAGVLLTSVEFPSEWPESMHATGDGHVIIAGTETEPSVSTLMRVEIATGMVDWELELDGSSAPQFAIASDGTIGVRTSALYGIDAAGEIVWTSPLASEEECSKGYAQGIVWAGDSFAVAGLQSFTDLAVVHHFSSAGVPMCGDARSVPTTTVTANAPLWMAPAGDGAWIVGSEFGNRCRPHRFWLMRTTAQ